MSRTAMVLFGCAVAWVLGVRTPRAASFETIEFAGKGRATLVIDEVGQAAPDAGTEPSADPAPLEIFAKLTFGTEISAFSRGLYARSSFTLPRTSETGVLVVDVDRAHGRRDWGAGDAGLRARFYTVPVGGSSRFDGHPKSGSLELESAIIGRSAAGFRIRGWLEMVDPGPDGRDDTADDSALEVDITLESIPTPEEIAGQPAPPPRQPQGGFCDISWCWTDDGYYDGYSYGYGCGDAQVGYDTTSDGCEGDTIDDGSDVIVDDGTTASPGPEPVDTTTDTGSGGCGDSTTSSSEDPGCEGTDNGSSSDGCDGGDSGDSSSGCGDSGSGGGCSDSSGGTSGCGSSGCEGDTLERAPGQEPGTIEDQPEATQRKAGVDAVGLSLFLAALATWISDQRRRRGRDD